MHVVKDMTYVWAGNLTASGAFKNLYSNSQLGAAGLGFAGAKLGLIVGGALAGPLGMGLWAAIGGAVGSCAGGLFLGFG